MPVAKMQEWEHCSGAPLLELWGMTELGGAGTSNVSYMPNVHGSIGFALPGAEARVAALDDPAVTVADGEPGELMIRGPLVMLGYYGNEDATRAAIEPDGWLHTGDIATIREDGCVRIVDRKNELFKTSGGKYIAPGRIESALLRSIYFNQVMVFGSGRPHPAALVSPNWSSVRGELRLPPELAPAELAARSDVVQLLQHEARLHTADLAPFEHIRTIGILPRDLTIEAGELSPTQKIRRRVVERLYAGLIDAVMPAVA
jgi:long-chain acyl-CoA synthetase